VRTRRPRVRSPRPPLPHVARMPRSLERRAAVRSSACPAVRPPSPGTCVPKAPPFGPQDLSRHAGGYKGRECPHRRERVSTVPADAGSATSGLPTATNRPNRPLASPRAVATAGCRALSAASLETATAAATSLGRRRARPPGCS
jgi:hypothetical protein